MYYKEWSKQYYIKHREQILKRQKQYSKENSEKIKEYHKEYYQKNKDKLNEYSEQWQKDNPEKVKKRDKRYYESHPEKVKEKDRQYYENNHEKIIERIRRWGNKKYKSDLRYNLNNKIRTAIRLSLNGNKNGRHWEDLIGYSLNKLIKHLKKTIPKGYTWQDFMKGKLHIDHIIPISAFNFTKPEHVDFKRCWSLNNLRLLTAKENLIKHNKLEKPFQPALRM